MKTDSSFIQSHEPVQQKGLDLDHLDRTGADIYQEDQSSCLGNKMGMKSKNGKTKVTPLFLRFCKSKQRKF